MNTPKRNYDHNKLQKRLRRKVGQAIADFNMIEEHDKVMVCLSGGADSYTMLDILLKLQQAAPISFSLIAVNLDQKQPNFPTHVLPIFLEERNIEYHVIEEDTYKVVTDIIPENKTYCGLCSRLRRGILYRFAKEHGYNKIALGHHQDDIIETFFLNLFYGGKLKAMPPKLLSDDGNNVVIRPLAYCVESDIKKYAMWQNFPIIPCDLCGSQDKLQRQVIKQMIQAWDAQRPGCSKTIFRSLQNVVPSHLLDSQLFDFATLSQTSGVNHLYDTPLTTKQWLGH